MYAQSNRCSEPLGLKSRIATLLFYMGEKFIALEKRIKKTDNNHD
jgi:hypothetical protein